MIQICREALRQIQSGDYRRAEAHAGLVYQTGLKEFPEGDEGKEKAHQDDVFKAIAEMEPPEVYRQAFRQRRAVLEGLSGQGLPTWVRIGKGQGRLLFGHGDETCHEIGLRVNWTYGMPIIPGSALKGIARNLVHAKFKHDPASPWYPGADGQGKDAGQAFLYTFGRTDEGGNVVFHDAWYVPRTNHHPFTQDVVTTHHRDWYMEGKPPIDGDTPIPNAFLAAQGDFLFAISGAEQRWVEVVAAILQEALETQGVGGKTVAGYGHFKFEVPSGPTGGAPEKIEVRQVTIAYKNKQQVWEAKDDKNVVIAHAKGNDWLKGESPTNFRNKIVSKGKRIKVKIRFKEGEKLGALLEYIKE